MASEVPFAIFIRWDGLTQRPWSFHPKQSTNQLQEIYLWHKRFSRHKFLMMGMHSFPICPPSIKLYRLHRKIMSISTLHYYGYGKCGRAISSWKNSLVIINKYDLSGMEKDYFLPLRVHLFQLQNNFLSFKSKKKKHQERQHYSKVWMAKHWKTHWYKNNPNRLSKSLSMIDWHLIIFTFRKQNCPT